MKRRKARMPPEQPARYRPDPARWQRGDGRSPYLAGEVQVSERAWCRQETWREVLAEWSVTDAFIRRLIAFGCQALKLVDTAPPVLTEGDGRLVWAKSGAEVDDLFDAMDAVDAWLTRHSTLTSNVRKWSWQQAGYARPSTPSGADVGAAVAELSA